MFWLTVSEGPVYVCLATNKHNSRSVWVEESCSLHGQLEAERKPGIGQGDIYYTLQGPTGGDVFI